MYGYPECRLILLKESLNFAKTVFAKTKKPKKQNKTKQNKKTQTKKHRFYEKH